MLRKFILALCVSLGTYGLEAQEENSIFKHRERKGKAYIMWGYNWSSYTDSDINFKGDGFDFTLHDVQAEDRPSPFDASVYFDPGLLSIPQWNVRFGYYINDKQSISFGSDHMKYVMVKDVFVDITGTIDPVASVEYTGFYEDGAQVFIHHDPEKSFLNLEHTDGLNYLHFEFDHMETFWVSKNDEQSLSVVGGVGTGILYPRSNTKLFKRPSHYDEFKLAGYGLSSRIGLHFEFYRNFYIRADWKFGYMNMPDIDITGISGEYAEQDFFFEERYIAFGGYIQICKPKEK